MDSFTCKKITNVPLLWQPCFSCLPVDKSGTQPLTGDVIIIIVVVVVVVIIITICFFRMCRLSRARKQRRIAGCRHQFELTLIAIEESRGHWAPLDLSGCFLICKTNSYFMQNSSFDHRRRKEGGRRRRGRGREWMEQLTGNVAKKETKHSSQTNLTGRFVPKRQ